MARAHRKVMSDQDWKNKGPWVAVDPSSKREWLLPQPLRYYIVEEQETRHWFVCDRWTDLPVPDTESKTRATMAYAIIGEKAEAQKCLELLIKS